MATKRKCKWCEHPFNIKGSQIFCSRFCAGAYQRSLRIGKYCDECGDYFEVAISLQRIKFCSRECKNKAQTGILKPHNEETKRKIGQANKGNRFSLQSRINMSLGQTKEKIFNGFKRKFKNQIRGCLEYVEWRKSVFSRDEYTCQDCGLKGGYLEAHHIIPFSEIIINNNIKTFQQARESIVLWDINNGITYCKECHIKNDTFRGKRKSTNL